MSLTREAVMALKAGPEMDDLVAERVMCWTRRNTYAGPQWYTADGTATGHGATFQGHETVMWLGWQPSLRIRDAWEAVDALRASGRGRHVVVNDGTRHLPTYEVQAGLDEHGPWTFCAFEMPSGEWRSARAEAAPLAICRAALLTTLDQETFLAGRREWINTRDIFVDGKPE